MTESLEVGFRPSPQQLRAWRLQKERPAPCSVLCALRIEGNLDPHALRRALAATVARHEILRTAFRLPAGLSMPLQVILEPGSVSLPEVDLRSVPEPDRPAGAAALLRSLGDPPFELERGEGWRALLARLGPREHELLLALSAACADPGACEPLAADLLAAYEREVTGGESDPEPPLQYADVAEWQHRLLEGEDAAEGIEAWREQWRVHDIDARLTLPLPLEESEAAPGPFTSRETAVPLDRETAGALARLAGVWDCPLPVLLLAAWHAVIQRGTGRDESLVGVLYAGREAEELRGVVGPLARYLPVAARFSPESPLREAVAQVRQTMTEAEPWAEYFSWDHVIGNGPAAGGFPVCFEAAPGEWELAMNGLRVASVRAGTSALLDRFALALSCQGGEEGLRLTLRYDSRRFRGQAARRLAGRLAALLGSVAARPEAPLADHPALAEEELGLWRELSVAPPAAGAAARGRDGKTLSAVFEEQVDRDPERLAVVAGEERLTFRELDARANRLAWHLRATGAGPEVPVALCLERSAEALVALLAVWKAGAFYVPLDPTQPAGRLAYILTDTGAPLLVTDSRLAAGLPAVSGVCTVRLDEGAAAIAARPADRPAGGAGPRNLAYTIYTSGSTGRPKGVQVEHRSPLCLLAALEAAVLAPLAGAEPLLASLNAPMIFDASVQQLVQLLAGHALCMIPEEVRADGAALVALLQERRVDLLDCTPSQLRVLVDAGLLDGPGGPRIVLTAGEAVDEPLWRRLARAERTVSFNLYGPTECSVDATVRRIVSGSTRPTIGRPLAGYEVFLLDSGLRPVPPGAPGEICLGGEGLARGYLRRPDLTAERFVPHPFAQRPGERLYRTGDLGRHLPDSGHELEFLGRLDHQVKIRGFRIELGEIEAALLAVAGVREAVVEARQDRAETGPDDRRLVAYVVGDVKADALRQAMRERLPEYMVPAVFVPLAALPLTPNGKVDRKALPAPEWHTGDQEYLAPRTPVEEILAGIWAELLGCERVGAADHFFELGGHSLLATQVMSRLRSTFEIEMPLRTLFEAPVLADLAVRIEVAQRTGTMPPAPPLVPVPRQGPLPLSFAQQRLWFIDQLEPGTSLYNIPVALRIEGPLRLEVLALCLSEIVRRHEALRTVFAAPEGTPIQVIQPATPFVLPMVDLSGLPESRREPLALSLAGEETSRPFDLACGPLLRGVLLQLDEDDHVAALTLHHIVSDGWSMGILVREMTALYSAFAEGKPSPLQELPIQYGDFTVWQRHGLQGEALEAEVSFWRDALRSLPNLELPTDRPRPRVRTSRGGLYEFSLSAEQSAALASLARAHGSTLYMVLLGGFAALLSRWTGQDDIVVGSTIASRNRAEIERLIGFFVNTLVLRIDRSGDPDFGQILERVRKFSLSAFAHQDLPFEKLVEELSVERDPSRTPLFQVLFALQNAGFSALSIPGLTLSPVETQTTTAKFDLTLSMTEVSEVLSGFWEYNRDLFDTATVVRMAGHLEVLLDGVLTHPGRPVSEQPLLSALERAQMLREWNDSATPCPQIPLVHDLFAAHARRRPESTALAWQGGRLTYGELDRLSDRLAHHLRSLGVGPETLVALCTERTCPQRVVGIVAVLKAGGAYVSLDPAYPPERLAFLLADSRAPVVLTQERFVELLPVSSATVIALDGDPATFGPEEGRLPDSGVTPDNLAYVVYTSGSTGKPKGVEIPHAGLMNLVRWHQTLYRVSPDDRGTQVASPAFDASIWELWPYLAAGASLHIPDDDTRLSAPGMMRWWAEEGITLAYLMTPLAEGVLEEEIPLWLDLRVRALIIGGDRLRRGPRPEAGFRLMNHYGPAEYTVTSTVVEVPPEGERRGIPTIGRPVDNTRIHVLDRALQPVPIGVLGELFVTGIGLARGYSGRPDLTAERFVPDPFTEEPGARIYRTGDLVRYLPDGDIDFQGRLDHQVKLRGLRIELGEIEAMLAQHPALREATVLVREDRPGDRRLVAYVVATDTQPGVEELRDYLKERLPEYMVPAVFVPLPALPLTPNGKVDRRALPAPEKQGSEEGWVAPRTPVEEVVAGLWAEFLGVERVGAADSFFDLGGHSLLATRVISHLQAVLGVEMSLRDLFEAPTLSNFAAHVDAARRAGAVQSAPPLVPVPREGPLPLSFAQQRLWFIDQLKPGTSLYNVPVTLRVEGPLHLSVLSLCLSEIVRRHEALRTVFAAPAGSPVQVIQPAAPFVLPVVDLSGLPESRREAPAILLARTEAGRPFDLRRGPLLRGLLVRLDEQDHITVLTMHHIVSDGWSMGILVREVVALYGAFAEGRPSPLPEPPLQYADFAVWQNTWLSGEVLEGEIDYWRRQLAGLPPLLEFPTDRPRPPVQSYRGAIRPVRLPSELTRQVQALGRREGATLFMVLLAAFQALLARYSGQQDLAVGSPIAGRNRAEIEGLIGFFVNTSVLRGDLTGEPSFRELLGRARETALAAYLHQDMPFEKLVLELTPDRSLAHSPLFQVMLVLQNAPVESLEIKDLRLQPVNGAGTTAKFDFTLNLVEWEGELTGTLEHATDLFDGTTMDHLAEHFERLLAEAVAAPERPVWELPLLGEAERQLTLVEWNDTAVEHGVLPLLPRLLEARVAHGPDGIAVEQGDLSLTYRELEARANRLAHLLIRHGVTPEDRVAICCDRSPEMVVSQLATWKAGAAWVPLEPSFPSARRATVLDDARPAVLIAGPGAPADLSQKDGNPALRVLDLDAVAAELAGAAGEDPGPPALPLTPDYLSYVIYTSGSTGRPKGVLVAHGAIANRLLWMRRALSLSALGPVGEQDAVLQKTPFVFDAAIWEMALPLLTGARLVLAPPGAHREPAVMAREVLEHGVSLLQLVPSALGPFLDEDLHGSPLRRLFCGGEALPAPLCQRAFERLPGIELRNLYGPTECAIDVTSRPCRPGEEGTIVPLGRPVDNLRIRILDRRLQPVPAGQPGELCAGGAGVARGYLGRSDLTAERFVPEPLGLVPGGRLYRTGDLVRTLPGGAIEFLGRLDDQVKIRGLRIELGEIEAALVGLPEVSQAVATVREDVPGDRCLVAYVVRRPADGEALQASQPESAASEHVAEWQTLYEETYGRQIQDVDPTFNTEGWNSSYTGEPIPAEEMREWVDATVERILGLGRRRVLEVGCGTGLLLFRIAPHSELYLGTDFSRGALDFVQRHLEHAERAGRALPQVSLAQRTADDWTAVPQGDIDLVVINSVAQYFPDIDYFVRVLERAVRTLAARPEGGSVFLGDMRSLPLLEALHTSIELFQAPPSMATEELRRRVRRRVANEEELVVDPELFFALARWMPEIRRVEILVKRGRYHNELTRFRYDAVLHVGGAEERRETPAFPPFDWREQDLSLAACERLLATDGPAALVLTGIPNGRLATESAALDLLAAPGQAGEMVEDLRQAIARRLPLAPQPGAAVDPEEIGAMGERLGYVVELVWAVGDGAREGWFAAVLRRPGVTVSSPPDFLPAHDAALRPWSAYANDPLRGRVARRLVPELRRALQAELPEYMIPSSILLLDSLPLTSNGKVDRNALPAPEILRSVPGGYVPPRTPTEEVISQIWAELLGIERVGATDHFFELGGHSLLATQVVSRLRSVYSIEMPVRDLFAAPVLADLAARIEEARRAGAAPSAPPLVPAPRQGPIPLSFAQQRLWFIDQLEPGTSLYNIPVALRAEGPLHLGVLMLCLSEIVRRHEALRTVFAAPEGTPTQVILPAAPFVLSVVDLSGLPESRREALALGLVGEEAGRPFDLTRGPLLRGLLLRLAEDDHITVLTMHHIVSDGWSMRILVREVTALYAAFTEGRPSPLPELPLQYADFAVWQRSWLHGEALERESSFWRRQLAGLPPLLELPTDRPRPLVQSFRGASRPMRLPAELTRQMDAVGRREGATIFMVLLAGFQLLLSRYSGQQDLAVGTPAAGRNRTEIEGLIGFFVNTLVLRGDLSSGRSGEISFRELLGRVRESALAAHAHQDVPFEKLVQELSPERTLAYTPLFQVMLVLQNVPAEALEIQSLRLRPTSVAGAVARFDLTLALGEHNGELMGGLSYATDLFDAATIDRLSGHLERLLAAAAATPDLPVSALPFLSPAELHELAQEAGRLGMAPDTDGALGPERCVHELFAERASRTPEALAVVDEERAWTYAELLRRVRRLALRLRAAGIGPDQPVILCAERGAGLVTGLLGILEAGGAYLAVEPDLPHARQELLAWDARVAVAVTESRLTGTLPTGLRQVFLDADDLEGAEDSELPVGGVPRAVVTPGNLAYVLYTSGSTGAPKGVMVEHRQLMAYVRGALERLAPEPGASFATVSSFAADLGNTSIFAALLGGGCLHVVARERLADATAFAELMARQPVDVLKIVPSHLAALLTAESPERSLPRRLLVLGGEPLPWSLVERVRSLAPECRLFNHYGPTETTVGVLAGAVEIQRHEMGEAGGTRGSGSTCAPLGWPLGQTRGWVVDRHLRLVPAGVPGELCVGGPQVTRGYLGRPDLTAERFIPDPFGGGAGERLYRTGDLVRRRPSGPIEFLGRTDHQVKVRGFRIELGEIEAALATLPGVREALVVAREDTPGERRLVAYVAGDVSETAVDTLRASLREQLPDYMVPAAFVTLTTLPLTSNGKVDRKALPAPEPPRPAESHSAMQTPIEDALAGIWAEFLGLEQVGATDHFFDLGGHSLLAVRLMSRIEHVFGVKLPISTLFEAPTVERLAGVLLRGSVPARHSPLVRLHTGGTGRPLFLVHPIGGDVSSYVELARRLGADRPVYALQPVTVEPGAERAAPSTMEEMARQYLAAMRQVQAGGPWLIAGWSFGAILAYEMAQQIESSGDTVALLAMIDPSAPPEARNERVDDIQLLAGFAGLGRPSERQRELLREMLAEVDVEAGLDRLLEFGQAEGVLPPDVGKPWLRERFDLFSRNVQVLRGYVARPYGGRVTFFRAGASLAQGTMELTSGWSTLAHTEAHLVDSDHVSMLRRPALDHLVEQLSTDLAAVEAGAEAP